MIGTLRTAAVVLAFPAVTLFWRPTSATAQTPLLEVEKADATKLMQVNDDGGLVVGGTETGAIPASGSAVRLMWYSGKAAFRAGNPLGNAWDDANVGRSSIAMGVATMASGEGSTAVGRFNLASGRAATAMGEIARATADMATAMGDRTTASGPASTAMGSVTKAIGHASTAMGEGTTASGPISTTMGDRTSASGPASTAMGTRTVAGAANAVAMGFNSRALGTQSVAMGTNALSGDGSFVFADNSTTSGVSSTDPNQFMVRASGGFRFRTSPTLNTGCDISAGNLTCTGTVSGSSSAARKTDFAPVEPDVVLEKVATLPIRSWRYRTDPDGVRHVGPTAEAFRDAFGLGGSGTTISMVDADGISLLAVQALERRTAELREENADLRRRLEALEAGARRREKVRSP